MVITNYDGLNVIAIIDAAELKALAAVLSLADLAQIDFAVKRFAFDGIEIDPEMVKAFCSSFTEISRKVTDMVKIERDEDDEADSKKEDISRLN